METTLLSIKNRDEMIVVPTYHCKKAIVEKEENIKPDKKVRVKLICVFPKKRYLVAKSTVDDYYSLFGGVVEQVSTKNYFMSILETLEKEFWEESSNTIQIKFNERKIVYKSKIERQDQRQDQRQDHMMQVQEDCKEELPFIYVGSFYESDTIFTVIYVPKFTNDLIDLWKRQMRFSQERLLKRLFAGWNINLEQLFEVNRVYHQKIMKMKAQYSYMPKTIYNFICSKLINYYSFLEKSGIDILEEEEFFNTNLLWEWNTMDVNSIKQKLKDLSVKTGVQF